MTPDAAMQRIRTIVARVVLSKGIGMFQFLEDLPMHQRTIAVGAIDSFIIDGLPRTVYGGLLFAPLMVGEMIETDAELNSWLARLARETRASLSVEDVIGLTDAMEDLTRDQTTETRSSGPETATEAPAVSLGSDGTDSENDALRRAVAGHFGLPVEQVEVIRIP